MSNVGVFGDKGSPPKTPTTLDEAIDQILTVGPLSEIKERSYIVLKDFMAQKFSSATVKAESDETMKILTILFEKLTVRPK